MQTVMFKYQIRLLILEIFKGLAVIDVENYNENNKISIYMYLNKSNLNLFLFLPIENLIRYSTLKIITTYQLLSTNNNI